MTTNNDATAFDCGDGVPNLTLINSGQEPTPRIENPPISARTVAMGLTVIGQLAILLAVLAGGNPVVGALAALALLVCGLTLLGARSIRAMARDDRPAENPFDGPSRMSNGIEHR